MEPDLLSLDLFLCSNDSSSKSGADYLNEMILAVIIETGSLHVGLGK